MPSFWLVNDNGKFCYISYIKLGSYYSVNIANSNCDRLTNAIWKKIKMKYAISPYYIYLLKNYILQNGKSIFQAWKRLSKKKSTHKITNKDHNVNHILSDIFAYEEEEQEDSKQDNYIKKKGRKTHTIIIDFTAFQMYS